MTPLEPHELFPMLWKKAHHMSLMLEGRQIRPLARGLTTRVNARDTAGLTLGASWKKAVAVFLQ